MADQSITQTLDFKDMKLKLTLGEFEKALREDYDKKVGAVEDIAKGLRTSFFRGAAIFLAGSFIGGVSFSVTLALLWDERGDLIRENHRVYLDRFSALEFYHEAIAEKRKAHKAKKAKKQNDSIFGW